MIYILAFIVWMVVGVGAVVGATYLYDKTVIGNSYEDGYRETDSLFLYFVASLRPLSVIFFLVLLIAKKREEDDFFILPLSMFTDSFRRL